MLPASNLASESTERFNVSVTAQALRQWCAPERIMAITDFADEETLLFHCIRQAKRSSATVTLAHVLQTDPRSASAGLQTRFAEPSSTAETSRRALERMARQLRWIGIPCEPLLLRGNATEELLAIAKARRVHRVILSAQWGGRRRIRTFAEELSPWAGVPVCAVGAHGSSGAKNDLGIRHITLALTLHPTCELLLRFAGRLAQEHEASLTILHVVESKDASERSVEQVSNLLETRLFASSLREAQLLCPVQIVVRAGDPANEILKRTSSGDHEFLIVGAPHSPCADTPGESSPVHRIVREARCPVMLVGPSTVQTHAAEHPVAPEELLSAVR